MFSLIRRRFGVGGLVATFAVLLAMTGGAWAAKRYMITSTSQISPKVLKALAGKSGAAGSPGAAGAAGAKGESGAKGEQGPKGEPGLKGEPGATGEPGKEGQPGKEGSPWTAGGTLPSGKSERGVWAFGSVAAEGPAQVPISFSIPLAASVKPHFVTEAEIGKGEVPAECDGGSEEEPKALPGNLCVYGGLSEASLGLFLNIESPAASGEGVGPAGTILIFSAKAKALGRGDWAVTAP
jgi:Collagen triple helix repeat (20 copies)